MIAMRGPPSMRLGICRRFFVCLQTHFSAKNASLDDRVRAAEYCSGGGIVWPRQTVALDVSGPPHLMRRPGHRGRPIKAPDKLYFSI
jgi:hypothetical protein